MKRSEPNPIINPRPNKQQASWGGSRSSSGRKRKDIPTQCLKVTEETHQILSQLSDNFGESGQHIPLLAVASLIIRRASQTDAWMTQVKLATEKIPVATKELRIYRTDYDQLVLLRESLRLKSGLKLSRAKLFGGLVAIFSPHLAGPPPQ